MDNNLIKKIHIFTKKNNPRVREKALELNGFFSAQGVESKIISQKEELEQSNFSPQVVFVLGGDGTFLLANYFYAPRKIPLLGIDMGGLGFLAGVSVDNILQAAEEVIKGNFKLEKRMMLDCEINCQGQPNRIDRALNDVVIYRGPFAQMIHLSTFVDDDFLASFPADGLIVATPTGSSAYSLSAGGPVVNPHLELFIITPICAHTLYARSIVAGCESSIKVKLESVKEGTMVTLDGQRGYSLKSGDFITVKKSSLWSHMVQLPQQRPFYSLLRSKLSWGMDIRKRIEEEC